MNRPVGVCITQNLRNPRISSAYKLYAFYYFYIHVVVLSFSVCQKNNNKAKCPNNKTEIYNDKYRHTRDRLFGLLSDHHAQTHLIIKSLSSFLNTLYTRTYN